MSYRGEANLDFAGTRMACLSGDNGAGKSALLDAMTWALWGKTRATSDRDVITLGETSVEATLVFRLGDRDYRVYRRRTDKGRLTLEFDARPRDAELWQQITGDSVRETQERIDDTLRLDYGTFVNSAFLMQGRADSFTTKSKGERKKVLGDILNLGDYESLSSVARESERGVRSKLEALRGLKEQNERRLSERAGLERQAGEAGAELIQVDHEIGAVKTEVEELSAQRTFVEQVREAHTQALSHRDDLAGRLGDLDARYVAASSELEELDALLAQADDIVNGKAELERWGVVLQSSSRTLEQRRPHEEAANQATAAIRQAVSEIERQIDRRTHEVGALQTQATALRVRAEELKQRECEAAADATTLQGLPGHRDRLKALELERTTLETENRRLREDMHEIKQKLAAFATGEGQCPLCRRPLAEGEHEHVAEAWQADGKTLGDRFRGNKARLEQIEIEISAATATLSQLERLERAQAERAGLIQRLQADIANLPPIEEQIDAATIDLDLLVRTKDSDSFAAEHRQALAAAEAALAGLPYDPATHREARQQVDRLTPYVQRGQELEQAQGRALLLSERRTDLAEQRDRLRSDIERVNQELESQTQLLANSEDIERRHAALRDRLQDLELERGRVQHRVGALQAQLVELENLGMVQREIEQECEGLALDCDAYKELVRAFGRDGIQAMIIETVLPELEDHTNRLLRGMSTGHLQVRFKTQREAVSNDNIIETLDIIIRDEYGERDYALYSGGEAFRINFAIRVALSKLLVRRAGATIDMLIIDEGFGTQDSRGRDSLVEAIRSIEDDFAMILVITHIDEIRDLFPTRLEVVKTAEGSRVTVHQQ